MGRGIWLRIVLCWRRRGRRRLRWRNEWLIIYYLFLIYRSDNLYVYYFIIKLGISIKNIL